MASGFVRRAPLIILDGPDHWSFIGVDMLPVDATVRSGIVTGRQSSEWLEPELQNVFAQDASKRFWWLVVKMKGMILTLKHTMHMANVQKIEVNGQPIVLDKEYTVTAYAKREGDRDMLCRICKESTQSRHHHAPGQRDYVHAFSPIDPNPHHNVRDIGWKKKVCCRRCLGGLPICVIIKKANSFLLLCGQHDWLICMSKISLQW